MKKLLSLILIFSILLNIFCISTVFADDRNPEMAELVSAFHRNVPTEFKKSNNPDDLLHYEIMNTPEQEQMYLNVRSQGEIICNEDKYLDTAYTYRETYGTSKLISVQGQSFKKAIRISCTQVPEKSTDFMLYTKATTERNPGDGLDKNDIMLFSFRMRTISTSESDGRGRVQVQIEHPKTYDKALYDFATAGSEWTILCFPFSGVEDATSIGIRCGLAEQTIELGGFEIINFGPDFDMPELPEPVPCQTDNIKKEQWRTDANARIEQLRKGDFSVIVKDKRGNLIPNAKVEFDMFEHEFHFGNAVNGRIHSNATYAQKHEELFNAAVIEHSLKWAPYESSPESAIKQVRGAQKAGAKYIRGHTLFWERMLASNGETYLTPEYMESEEVMTNKDKYLEYCKAHIQDICTDFYNDFVEWDVINEIVTNRKFVNVHGTDTWKKQFEWAREYTKPGTDLYYNDFAQFDSRWISVLEEFIATGADFDGIGFQSHYDGNIPEIPDIIALYELLEKYGDKKIKVTEFSCSIADPAIQANFTRDALISAFAEDDMTGFLYWGFWDGANYAAHSPFYDTEWNLKPAGEVYIDLVYNKWWTRDAKATTDKYGKATINGFYGDYDVTVNVDGVSKTVMAAYHKGYDNVLEITLDDYVIENSQNDMFSFVYSGKVQVSGKLTSDYVVNNPNFPLGLVSLIMTDKDGNIGHIAQTKINSDNTYSFEFKKDDLIYQNGKVQDYYITVNVNGITVTDTVNTSMIIPECVSFDFDITKEDDKINVVTTLNNLIKRKGLDYTVYTAFYNHKNSLVSIKRNYSSSTGAATDTTTISGLEIPDNAKYIKVLVWMNNAKMIPLSDTITKNIE